MLNTVEIALCDQRFQNARSDSARLLAFLTKHSGVTNNLDEIFKRRVLVNNKCDILYNTSILWNINNQRAWVNRIFPFSNPSRFPFPVKRLHRYCTFNIILLIFQRTIVFRYYKNTHYILICKQNHWQNIQSNGLQIYMKIKVILSRFFLETNYGTLSQYKYSINFNIELAIYEFGRL